MSVEPFEGKSIGRRFEALDIKTTTHLHNPAFQHHIHTYMPDETQQQRKKNIAQPAAKKFPTEDAKKEMET